MAKGGTKKKKILRKGTWDEATDSNSDGECEEVITVESLLGRLNEVMDEYLVEHDKVKALSRTNKQLTMNLEELNVAYEELKGDHETLAEAHNDLLAMHEKLDRAHGELNSSYKELEKLFN